MDANYHLANKKALFMNISQFYNLQGYDPFDVAIPLTFHIKTGNDPEYGRFEKMFNQFKQTKSN